MEDFVDFSLAVKLKEKGFRELCLAYYTNDDTLYYNYSHKTGASYKDCYLSHNLMPKDSVSGKFVDAPTISQVLKWLREEKEIMTFPIYSKNTSKWYCSIINADSLEMHNLPFNDSYELAALAGVAYCLDNLI